MLLSPSCGACPGRSPGAAAARWVRRQRRGHGVAASGGRREGRGRGGGAKRTFIFPFRYPSVRYTLMTCASANITQIARLFTGGVGKAMVKPQRESRKFLLPEGGCYAHRASECGLEPSAFRSYG